MPHSNLITQKLFELIDLAEKEGEPAAQVVLLALQAARKQGDDILL